MDSATDYAIAQGWADPNRLAIFGWSAGGFMTSWTVTQTSRYKAAIEGAGITDWASFMWTSDVQQIDYDQRWPEKDPQAFLQFSAVMQAAKVTTPLLDPARRGGRARADLSGARVFRGAAGARQDDADGHVSGLGPLSHPVGAARKTSSRNWPPGSPATTHKPVNGLTRRGQKHIWPLKN